jgi:hypothetical protein
MNDAGIYIWLEQKHEEDELPTWKTLDLVIRQWVALTGHEKDQSNYAKMKEMYQ